MLKRIILFISLWVIVFHGYTQNWEVKSLIYLQENHIGSTKFLNGVSSMATPMALITPISAWSYGFIKKDSVFKHKGFVTFIGIGSAMTLSTIFKYSINRPRPYVTHSEITKLGNDFTPSFPSGHTTSAFATATNLSILFPKWYVIAPAYAWASLEAYSRMALGVHYPSDVIAGAFLGTACSYGSYYITKKILNKRRKNCSEKVWQ